MQKKNRVIKGISFLLAENTPLLIINSLLERHSLAGKSIIHKH